jgi:hypothetical protein
MIKLTGITLRVKKIRQGRFGDFCVADLSTDIGEFKVKDPILDQFDDGEYTGTVWISEIFLSQYMAWGKAVTEIRARLHDLQLDSGFERESVPESLEPDPAEETQPRPAPRPAHARGRNASPAGEDLTSLKERLAKTAIKPVRNGQAPSSAQPDRREQGGDHDAETIELFGDLWPQIQNKQPVKFDATVDRLVLRKQSSKMNELGYKFNPIEQTWHPV